MVSIRTLTPPHVDRRVFSQNLLENVIAEIRFPTLLSLEKEPPEQIAKAWRKTFPNYTPGKTAEIGPAGIASPTANYHFSDRYQKYNVTLTSSSIALSTTKYSDFESFLSHLLTLISGSLEFLETDFFTRIGLRYINKIEVPNNQQGFRQAVNSELAGALCSDVMGSIVNLKTEIQGRVGDTGTYVFRYGIANDVEKNQGDQNINSVILDYDYGATNVDENEVEAIFKEFHNIHFPFFLWTLGDKARSKLEES